MLKVKKNTLDLVDGRNPFDIIFNYGLPSVTYTLKTDDITKGEKPAFTPYASRIGMFEKKGDTWYNEETATHLRIEKDGVGVRMILNHNSEEISEWGLSLPFNFVGKKYGGGWRNQFLLNAPYITNDRKFKSFYFTKVNGNNLLVVVLSKADGWKMDYSPFHGGLYFYNFKILANFDRAYGGKQENNELVVGFYPVKNYTESLELMSKRFNAPFMYSDFNAGEVGKILKLKFFGDCDKIIEKHNGKEQVLLKTDTYEIKYEQETELIPCIGEIRGAGITLYGYKDLVSLYKKAMDSVDLDVVKNTTDSNLCEQQCWASAMVRFLTLYKERLTKEEVEIYEGKLNSLLDRVTETDESKAEVRLTIFDKPHGDFPAYNVYKSQRVQEQYFGITLLLDAYKYFKNEKYLTYAINATDSLLDTYQKQDGRIEVTHTMKGEDYTAVCTPMIPLADLMNFIKDTDKTRAKRYYESATRICEYLYNRGFNLNTEGGITDKADKPITDGGLCCTALTLLYYCKNIKSRKKYLKFVKEILDVHESWVMKSPIVQIRESSIRVSATNWDGDKDGPALDCAYGWTIWRAECNWLYYELTGDEKYRDKAINAFNTNFAKINEKGEMFPIYNVDDINGGGFNYYSDDIEFKIASKFSKQTDSGLTRYVWIRAVDTILK